MLLRKSVVALLLTASLLSVTATQQDGQCDFDAADVAQQQQHSIQEQHKTHLQLLQTARLLVAPGKGILAADESAATVGRR